MEDILLNLNSFNVTGQPNSIHAEHPRFAQFKIKQSKSSQQERRKAVLAARKDARYDLLNHMRRVEQGLGDEEEDAEDDQNPDHMEGVVECYQKPKHYKDFLMLSEWLVDVPEDFATAHLAVPCPVGKRCLVVAAHGKTIMYGRNGKMLEKFFSVFPGGSHLTSQKGFAMLDCVVNYTDNTFYILDMVAWGKQSVMQCETPFRFEWVRSRLDELEYDSSEVTANNDYKFVNVKYHECDKASLQRMMEEPFSFGVPIDGILFYHKNSHYTHGPSPLVGWLKAFMMEEILDVPVPDHLKSDKPEKYTTLTQHIEYGKQARAERLQKNTDIKEQKKEERQKKHQENIAAKKELKKNAMDMTPANAEESEGSSSATANDSENTIVAPCQEDQISEAENTAAANKDTADAPPQEEEMPVDA